VYDINSGTTAWIAGSAVPNGNASYPTAVGSGGLMAYGWPVAFGNVWIDPSGTVFHGFGDMFPWNVTGNECNGEIRKDAFRQ
jgi:hypothetical protein